MTSMTIRTVVTLILAIAGASRPFSARASDNPLPNIVILATGGTIAGSGKTSTTTVGYKAATVAVEQLIEAVPELKKISSPRGEQ